VSSQEKNNEKQLNVSQSRKSQSKMSSEAGPSGSVDRMAERKKKLAALHRKRNESRQLNHAEVVEEDRRSKEPKNMEVRKRKAAYLLEEEEFKAKCEAEGKDWQRERLRSRGADVAEAIDKQKRSKTDPDKGFSSYEEASFRKYNQLVKQIKPDLNAYAEAKEAVGEEAFYADANTYVHGMHKDTPEALERLSKDIKDQEAKREKYSRRRVHDDDSDIDYINERNMKFNQKLERFYGKYTKDIKDNLERGTAV